jgi:methylated-DNA-[protein]-cysteine S-methyltransferase
MGVTADDGAISRVVLPHYQRDDLEALLAWEHPNAQAHRHPFEPFIERCRAYFNTRRVDFDDLDVLLPKAGSFARLVLDACRAIPYGQTLGYQQLAVTINRPDAARAVARALGENHTPLIVPCHRVTYADGRAGGFSAEGGAALKERMLAMEATGAE